MLLLLRWFWVFGLLFLRQGLCQRIIEASDPLLLSPNWNGLVLDEVCVTFSTVYLVPAVTNGLIGIGGPQPTGSNGAGTGPSQNGASPTDGSQGGGSPSAGVTSAPGGDGLGPSATSTPTTSTLFPVATDGSASGSVTLPPGRPFVILLRGLLKTPNDVLEPVIYKRPAVTWVTLDSETEAVSGNPPPSFVGRVVVNVPAIEGPAAKMLMPRVAGDIYNVTLTISIGVEPPPVIPNPPATSQAGGGNPTGGAISSTAASEGSGGQPTTPAGTEKDSPSATLPSLTLIPTPLSSLGGGESETSQAAAATTSAGAAPTSEAAVPTTPLASTSIAVIPSDGGSSSAQAPPAQTSQTSQSLTPVLPPVDSTSAATTSAATTSAATTSAATTSAATTSASTTGQRVAAVASAKAVETVLAQAGTKGRAAKFVDGQGKTGLIVAYAVIDGTTTAIRTTRLLNGATSWEAYKVVKENAIASDDTGDPTEIVQLTSGAKKGRLLVAYKNFQRSAGAPGVAGEYAYYRISVYSSDNLGTSWTFHSHCYERLAPNAAAPAGANPAPNPNAISEPVLRLAAGDKLQCYFSEETGKTAQSDTLKDRNIALWQTPDADKDQGSVTWSYIGTPVGEKIADTIFGQAGVAALDDKGKLIIVFSSKSGTTAGDRYKIQYATSDDDGVKWTDPVDLYKTTKTGKGVSYPQVANVDGVLVAAYMTDEDETATTTTEDGYNFYVRTSTDGGKTWVEGKKISSGAHFPGLLTIDKTNFLATWSSGTALVDQQYVVS